MRSSTPVVPPRQIAFRCDGDELTGAGHVGRCLPLAAAFARLAWEVCFVGTYGGLASWLLVRAGMPVRPTEPDAPCGIAAHVCDAAVIDSYRIAPGDICELARALPVATLGEANRCSSHGILVDYHLDRTEPSGARLLAGPSFAPLDPGFAGAGRAGSSVRTVLVTLGGSLEARGPLAQVVPLIEFAFPDADILIAGGMPPAARAVLRPRVVSLPSPSALVDVMPQVDIAVTAAGLTAYELACAGIPQVAIAIVANQSRVVQGLRDSGLALCLDLTANDSLADLPATLERLKDAALRRRLAMRGKKVFDGQGARRAATALAKLFGIDEGAANRLPAVSAGD